MNLLEKLETIDLKYRQIRVTFLEFIDEIPKSTVPALIGIKNTPQSNFPDSITLYNNSSDGVTIDYWSIPKESLVEKTHPLQLSILNSTVVVVLISDAASVSHNALWHYVIGNEMMNPKIPVFVVSEIYVEANGKNCKQTLSDELDLNAAWLREFEIHCITSPTITNLNDFITKLMSRIMAFLFNMEKK